MSKSKLSKKQEMFALEYIKDFNATRAYKEVYKTCKKDETAQVDSSRLLGNARVQTYIQNIFNNIRSEKIADAEEVMEYLTKVLRGESQSEIVVVEGTGDGCSSARKMNKAPDEKDRLKAAELLGRRYGIFTDNLKTSSITVKIVNDLEDDPEESVKG